MTTFLVSVLAFCAGYLISAAISAAHIHDLEDQLQFRDMEDTDDGLYEDDY